MSCPRSTFPMRYGNKSGGIVRKLVNGRVKQASFRPILNRWHRLKDVLDWIGAESLHCMVQRGMNGSIIPSLKMTEH